MIGKFPESFVESASECRNFSGIFSDGFLAPTVRNCAQQGDKSGGCGEDDSLVDASLYQAWIALEGSGEKRLTGKKKYGEFWGLGKL